MLKDLIKRNRSYRRFYQDKKISCEKLTELIDLARLSPCGGNRQALRFFLCDDDEKNAAVDKCIAWAAYYKDWAGPADGEKPSAYILILRQASTGAVSADEGIAAQSIMLGAAEKNMGGCIIANVKHKELQQLLHIDDKYNISLVLALGYPKEKVIIEEMNESGDVKYWRDENQVHHVPKRKLDDLIIG